ncbi:hypothetical protein BKK79_01110 [Cupriavidus sp. USMAA2-4]|uniref:Uncharacterized protein n=1 Tax=Cupriavidus malaysiensis TaxID=367825 RepID=A0ABN4TGX9_9BURK|nr:MULTISPECIES: hypothetical protein [Cupriavidus]AOY90583.1 hypothetical protein BKK79_01110 [Cupriavidus sp. USMAA2-4]AOY99791.1 hypothetical protein BKK81_11465 [Cupriavidus sp. USMAHM13]AOZ06417.1 hypothetical protein BKK80_11735 [Cupriavidus malaysiensis]
MSVTLKFWSEDGEVAAVDVPPAELATQLNPSPTGTTVAQPPAHRSQPERWTMPDEPDHLGDFA